MRLKLERFHEPVARAEDRKEYDARCVLRPDYAQLATPVEALDEVNAKLWEAEDRVRACEDRQDFGLDFVAFSSSVYTLNDERAALKREISRKPNNLGSRFLFHKLGRAPLCRGLHQ